MDNLVNELAPSKLEVFLQDLLFIKTDGLYPGPAALTDLGVGNDAQHLELVGGIGCGVV